MDPKTLEYLMGHSDIGVTMNTYTHLGMNDAQQEILRMKEQEAVRKELDRMMALESALCHKRPRADSMEKDSCLC